MYRGLCVGKPQYISTMANMSPFRKCSYCGETDKPYERARRLRRRAWTQFQVTRKFCCPNCEQKGREDERKARQLILRNHELLRDRLLAEPIAQYQHIKVNYPDALLIFRMGDEYTAFGDDAITLHGLLGLRLITSEHGAPFTNQCTFPYSALEDHLPRMVRAGHRIAICDKFDGVDLTTPLDRKKEEVVPSIVCEPYDDPPFRKTHRISLRGQEEQFDVHLMEGMFYALNGSWGLLTTDWPVEIILTYHAEYAAHSDLSMVADKPSRYEKNENARLASKLKMVAEILERYGALPSPRLGQTYVARESQINWEFKLPEIMQHLSSLKYELIYLCPPKVGVDLCSTCAQFIHFTVARNVQYKSSIESARTLFWKLMINASCVPQYHCCYIFLGNDPIGCCITYVTKTTE